MAKHLVAPRMVAYRQFEEIRAKYVKIGKCSETPGKLNIEPHRWRTRFELVLKFASIVDTAATTPSEALTTRHL
jgi:hypothetical protein